MTNLEIHKAAIEWSEQRSIGDKAQDRDCYFDYREGMMAAIRRLKNEKTKR